MAVEREALHNLRTGLCLSVEVLGLLELAEPVSLVAFRKRRWMLADFFWSVGLKGRGLWQKNPHSQRPSLFSILLLEVFWGAFLFSSLSVSSSSYPLIFHCLESDRLGSCLTKEATSPAAYHYLKSYWLRSETEDSSPYAVRVGLCESGANHHDPSPDRIISPSKH